MSFFSKVRDIFTYNADYNWVTDREWDRSWRVHMVQMFGRRFKVNFQEFHREQHHIKDPHRRRHQVRGVNSNKWEKADL